MDKLGFWLMILFLFVLVVFSVCYIFLDDLKIELETIKEIGIERTRKNKLQAFQNKLT